MTAASASITADAYADDTPRVGKRIYAVFDSSGCGGDAGSHVHVLVLMHANEVVMGHVNSCINSSHHPTDSSSSSSGSSVLFNDTLFFPEFGPKALQVRSRWKLTGLWRAQWVLEDPLCDYEM